MNKLEHIKPYDYRLLDTPPAKPGATRGWINMQKDKIRWLVDRMVDWQQLKMGTSDDKYAVQLWKDDTRVIYEYVLTVTDQRRLTRTDKKNANDMWKRYLI